MNNKFREEWVLNDERVYRWWKSERTSLTRFIKEHRTELDEYITSQLKRKTTTHEIPTQ